MEDETRRTEAQYLNGLAVAAVSGSVAAVLGGFSVWMLLVGGAASLALHSLAVWRVRQ
ncbi:MAG TPA: hypothetical protein VIL88_11465 [Devosia sp.]|uniref:hypothetical protein n=1 Tax=Devosia sp. TaxID=1871048 RepID=UPI002F920709